MGIFPRVEGSEMAELVHARGTRVMQIWKSNNIPVRFKSISKYMLKRILLGAVAHSCVLCSLEGGQGGVQGHS